MPYSLLYSWVGSKDDLNLFCGLRAIGVHAIGRLKELAFVGVDAHKDEHIACMSDCFGQPLGVFTVGNRPDHMDGLLKEIDKAAKFQELLRIYPTPSG